MGYLNPILGQLGVTHDLWLFIHFNWTFFAIYYDSGAMSRNVYSSAVFAGSWPLCTQILLRQGRPHRIQSPSTILGIKNRDTGYPTVKTASSSLVLTQYRGRTDRQTDGRICRSTYSACKASFATCCIKTNESILSPKLGQKCTLVWNRSKGQRSRPQQSLI